MALSNRLPAIGRIVLCVVGLMSLAACSSLDVVWEPHRLPATMDTYTLQGLELTEEIRFVEGEPTLFLQLAVTSPVTVESLEAHYTYYDYSGRLTSDRRTELESQTDDLGTENSNASLRVPVDTRYTPSDGQHDIIGSYMLPLGSPDAMQLIGYRVIVKLASEDQMEFSNGKIIRIENNSVYRPLD